MPNTREKLIELISESRVTNTENSVCLNSSGHIADHLIANGVTVQEWVPVTERLPEPRVWVLCAGKYTDDLHILRRRSSRKDESWEAQVGEGYYSELITHWMPLPEPPKGE